MRLSGEILVSTNRSRFNASFCKAIIGYFKEKIFYLCPPQCSTNFFSIDQIFFNIRDFKGVYHIIAQLNNSLN